MVKNKKLIFCLTATMMLVACKGKPSVSTQDAVKNQGGNQMVTTKAVEKNTKVKINYTLTVDQKVVDSSEGREPLSFVQGTGAIIPGLEEQLEGMRVGQKKSVTVSPEKGYGLAHPEAVQKVPKTAFQKGTDVQKGMAVHGQNNGHSFQATVVSVDKDGVTLDFNHPLAGKTLNFQVEVVDVQ